MLAPRLFAQLTFTLIALLAVPCFALQSGSRSSGSGVAPISPGRIAPSFSSPVQTVTPQGFPSATGQLGEFAFGQDLAPTGSGTRTPNFQSQPPTASQPAGSSGVAGIPDSSLVDPVFQVSDPWSPIVVDHSLWDAFLCRYLVTDSVGINRVHYGRVTSQDRQLLESYLNQLQATDIRTLNRNEQLAYWFNLYNAKTVAVVIDNYPIRSVRQIKQKFTDFVGPFDDEGAVNVLGKSLSLNDIESGIIRPVWNDPRIHYALNCASYGCPNLAPQAWNGHDIDARLNSAAWDYINSDRAVKRGLFGVKLAKIYKWYSADFGGTDAAVLNHIRQYANENTLRKIGGQSRVGRHFYDWSLNDAKFLRPRLLEGLIR